MECTVSDLKLPPICKELIDSVRCKFNWINLGGNDHGSYKLKRTTCICKIKTRLFDILLKSRLLRAQKLHALFRSEQLLTVSPGLKALAKNTLHISHLSESKHPLHPHANGSWRHHTDLIGLYIHSHYSDSQTSSTYSQINKKPPLLLRRITSNYIRNDRDHSACSQMGKGLLCLVCDGGKGEEEGNKPVPLFSGSTGVSVMTISKNLLYQMFNP